MRYGALALTSTVIFAGMVITTPAFAHSGHHPGGTAPPASGDPAGASHPARGASFSLAANLSGNQEVPVAGGPATGDKDGSAQAVIRVKGDRVSFALTWHGISAPTLSHIHEGTRGANGDVKVPLFTSAMPDTVTSAAGQVTVRDAGLARRLRENPAGFYVNLHSEEFPGGAVRGQLNRVRNQVNPLGIINGGALQALSDGDQEVPKDDKSKVGDPDGRAVTFLDPEGSRLNYSMAWLNTGSPTLGHVHQGPAGKNGEVRFPLFTTPVPAGIFAISGTLSGQDPAMVEEVRNDPGGFYANLHTAEFPDGAVRGQLFGSSARSGHGTPPSRTGASPAPEADTSVLLFDEPGTFSESNPSMSVVGRGCVDVPRPGVASALRTPQPVKLWSGTGCTGTSKVINGDVSDLGAVGFDNKISSVFLGAV
ncbi:CHRD domain-containing protein [Streptomyces sp. AK02-01A]|uniref:CHRD domain-containing protein n=1 Tax=Streptomyces sp. AK02-01A TaxID=3028648 RepID=UPI0029B20583|nr:CHRD domain-containing protein [Streptomyces sp. AK02-01A]MDX3850983.1 CHRD domain-containing protein [Streptomyces sp. AK02-01A]